MFFSSGDTMGKHRSYAAFIRKVYLPFLAALTAMLLLLSCDYPGHIRKQRATSVEQSNSIVLGVVWDPARDSSFPLGARFAAEELNKKGGILGKTVEIRIMDEDTLGKNESQLRASSWTIAEQLARTEKLVGVIGHTNSTSALAASPIYDRYQVLFIAPAATANSLTRANFRRLFQTSENDAYMAYALAHHAKEENFERIAIVSTVSSHGINLSNAFVEALGSMDLENRVVYHRSVPPSYPNLYPTLDELNKQRPTAVLLAGDISFGLRIIGLARELGYKGSFFASDAFYSDQLVASGGELVEGLTVVTSIPELSEVTGGNAFVHGFRRRFGTSPNGWALQAYDAVMLFASAAKKSNSLDSSVVASTLRYRGPWTSGLASYEFAEGGNVIGRPIYVKVIKKGVFQTERVLEKTLLNKESDFWNTPSQDPMVYDVNKETVTPEAPADGREASGQQGDSP